MCDVRKGGKGQPVPNGLPASAGTSPAPSPRLNGKAPAANAPVHHDVTRIYLSEIGRARLLTPEEEVSFGRAARSGCMASRQRMIESNLRLVVSVARKYVKRGLPLLDLVRAAFESI